MGPKMSLVILSLTGDPSELLLLRSKGEPTHRFKQTKWFPENYFLKYFIISLSKSISIIFVWFLEKGRFGQVDKFISDLYFSSAHLPGGHS